MTSDAPARARIKIEDSPKRIRGYLDGELVVDSTAVKNVWEKPYYPTPLPESSRIAGLVAFYNEKLDIYTDGELQERPRTKFS